MMISRVSTEEVIHLVAVVVVVVVVAVVAEKVDTVVLFQEIVSPRAPPLG